MSPRRHEVTLLSYVFQFTAALTTQLLEDEKRHKDAWRKLPKEGQEDRSYQRFEQYWVEFSRDGLPIPWLKVAGLAMIAWVRDNFPESLIKTYVDHD